MRIDDTLLEGSLFDDGKPFAQWPASWPDVLRKMVVDDGWDYLLRLRTGELLTATGASPVDRRGRFVCLHGVQFVEPELQNAESFRRGFVVRVSCIAWLADGGHR